MADPTDKMESIINLCKRRGFVFPSSDIYGGFNGFFDYGPLGVELKNNIKQAWWQDFVHRRDDIVGLDSSIIHHPTTWKASGHIENFTDPLVDCKESKMRYRADQLFFAPVRVAGETIGYVSVLEDDGMQAKADEMANDMKRKLAKQGALEPVVLKDYTESTTEEHALIPSPATGKPGSLTPPRSFNMMFQTYVGAMQDASATAYLRPETAQGIFINFKNVVDTGRVKLPFGIAQIGKAFRNEINPRNFIFRSREFEQMEIEYFISPAADWSTAHKDWIEGCLAWFESIGIPRANLSLYPHPTEKLAHYSKGTTDIMFEFPFGVQELQGVAARGDFDLTQHSNVSGQKLDWFDEVAKARYIPHVIEPSVGVDRLGGRLWQIVVAVHHAGTLHQDLTVRGDLDLGLRQCPTDGAEPIRPGPVQRRGRRGLSQSVTFQHHHADSVEPLRNIAVECGRTGDEEAQPSAEPIPDLREHQSVGKCVLRRQERRRALAGLLDPRRL